MTFSLAGLLVSSHFYHFSQRLKLARATGVTSLSHQISPQMLLESEDWVWAARAVRAEVVTMTLGLGILVPSWNRPIRLLELHLLSLEMLAAWLSLPFLLVSKCAHPWTLGRALRRNIPCLYNSLSLPNSPGIGAPFPFSSVYLRACRQASQGWAGQDLSYSTGKKESTYWGQFL